MSLCTVNWLLHGPHWSLPVSVAQVEGLMRVRPVGTLTKAMLAALRARIAELGTTNGQDWYLTRETLERFADALSNGNSDRAREHPDDFISWVNPTNRFAPDLQPKSMEGFYDAFVRAGHAKSIHHAQIIYGAWCQCLLNWLLIENKPADLGFAVIDAIPTRADWQEILDRRLKDIYTTPVPEKIRKILVDGTLMMFDDKKGIAFWSLGVRHRKAWWRGVIKKETAALKRKGKLHYMTKIRDYLESKQDALYEIFRDRLTQTGRKTLRIPKRVSKRGTDGKIIRPSIKRVARLLKIRTGSGEIDARFGFKGFKNIVGQTIKNVPPLSGLQPRAEDVWDDHPKPEDPATGTEG